jgi:hypothetical protein
MPTPECGSLQKSRKVAVDRRNRPHAHGPVMS